MSRKMITSLALAGSLAIFAGCKSNNTQPVAEVPPPQPITAANDPLLTPAATPTVKGASAKGQPVVHPVPAGSDSFTLGPGAPVYGAGPALTPPPAGPVAKGAGSYTVRQGDTLWSIAKNHLGNGSRWREISNANNGLKPEQLKVGSAITLP